MSHASFWSAARSVALVITALSATAAPRAGDLHMVAVPAIAGARAQSAESDPTVTALAVADFDGNGLVDLVTAVDGEDGARLDVHPANLALQRPWMGDQGSAGGASPFLPAAASIPLPEPVDLIAVGDLDGDGRTDVVLAARGTATVWLLPGDGHGGFAEAFPIDVAGRITALDAAEIDRPGGTPELVVGLNDGNRSWLAMWTSPTRARHEPREVVDLPGPALRFVAAALDPDPWLDLVIATPDALIVAHGRDTALRLGARDDRPARSVEVVPMPRGVADLATGSFVGAPAALAVLTADGHLELRLAPPAEEEAAVWTPTDSHGEPAMLPVGFGAERVPAPARIAAVPLSGWPAVELDVSGSPPGRLRACRVAATSSDSLALVDATGLGVLAWDGRRVRSVAAAAAPRISRLADLVPGAHLVATARLNSDGVDDMVVVGADGRTPFALLSAPELVLTVDATGDAGDASPGDGVCQTSGGVCTLRAALQEAQATAGADTIGFGIAGAGPFVIRPTSQLPRMTTPVTIDGTTQPGYSGTPLIELDGSLASSGADGLKLAASSSVVKGLAIYSWSRTGGGLGGFGVSLERLVGEPENIASAVESCALGTNGAGASGLGNEAVGVGLVGTSQARVGGTAAGAGNVASGNDGFGVEAVGSALSLIEGNRMGTNAAGTAALANAFAGVALYSAPGTTVGGTAAGAGNLISGNGANGGIYITGNTGSYVVQGNWIGLDSSGITALPNLGSAMLVQDSLAVLVGGSTSAARNVISGNRGGGLWFRSVGASNGHLVAGNYIGTDWAGVSAIPNEVTGPVPYLDQTAAGISVKNAQVTIGGTSGTAPGGPCTGSCNLVSGNLLDGIVLEGAPANGVGGNFVGTDFSGLADLGNSGAGVVVLDSNGNQIGGDLPAARNVISGNGLEGVLVTGGNIVPTANLIIGNHIGVGTTGSTAIPNDLVGVGLLSADANQIGGVPGRGNVISGNASGGVTIDDGQQNLVRGNVIGLDSGATSPLPNVGDGVLIVDGIDNAIGGAGADDPNTIASNSGSGVRVSSGTGNAILGNAIHDNDGLGIDLDPPGVNLNDPDDSDTGPNQLQNYPAFTSITPSGADLDVEGRLESAPSTMFRIELFASSAADPSGYGEGELYLGSIDAITDISGVATFSLVASGVPPGWILTATATDPAGNTSEMSCAGVCGLADLAVSQTDDPDPVAVDQPLTYTVTVSNGGPSTAEGTTLVDTLPTDATPVSSVPSQGSCGESSGVVTCDLGSLASGAHATVLVKITPGTPGTATNRAEVAASTTDPDLSNNVSLEETTVRPGPFIVNDLGDGSDPDLSDDRCDVDPDMAGDQCTLRAAIEQANATAGADTILFDLGGGGSQTIAIGSSLPAITEEVFIDGSSQPGFSGLPLVQIDGGGGNTPGEGPLGLFGGIVVSASATLTHLKGLSVTRILGPAVTVAQAPQVTLENLLIGTNQALGGGLGNDGDGILIDNAPSAIVRSSTIVGSTGAGVTIAGQQASQAQLLGNLLGLARKLDGTYLKLGNQDGVVVDGAPDASIGGVADGAGNIIAGNNGLGVMLKDLDVASLVGNLVGTDPAGTPGMGNGSHGVLVQDSKNVALGLPSGGGNILAGNGGYGAFLKSTDATLGKLTELIQVQQNVMGSIIQNLGNAPVRAGQLPTGSSFLGNIFSKVLVALPNGLGGLCALDTHDVTVGGIGNLLGNILSGNSGPGAHVTGPSSQTLKLIGNLFGTDGPVSQALANGGPNILIENAPGATVGGAAPGEGNTLVASPVAGIEVTGSESSGAAMFGNVIGLIKKLDGTYLKLGNQDGVVVDGAPDASIGGVADGAGNIIAGNNGLGVMLKDLDVASLVGNLVGTDPAGTPGMGNGSHGVLVQDSKNVALGLPSGGGNILAGNGGYGAFLKSTDATLGKLTELIQVQQNVMGSIIQNLGNAPVRAGQLPTGSSFLGNIFSKVLVALPNGLGGLCALDTHDVTVGGIGNLLGNILSGNSGPGAHVTGPSSQTLKLIGNLFGTDGPVSQALANGGPNILIENAPGATVGGAAPGEGNTLVASPVAGIEVTGSESSGAGMFGNVIGLIKKLDGTYLKLGNQDGVVVDGAPDASIGGVADGAGNIIAGNNGLGVMLKDLDVASLVGNLVGTDPAGTPGMGNGSHGVLVQDSKNVALGLPSGGGNILAGNGGYGAFLKSTDATLGKLTELIQVQQNVMGSIIQNLGNAPVRAGQLPTGSSFLGNIFSKVLVALPNGLGGLCALDTHDVTVGGIGNLLGNILSGNSGPGAHVTGPSSQTLKLIGNLFGTDGPVSQALANGGPNILIENAPGATVGGAAPGEGNTLVASPVAGIEVTGSESSGAGMFGNVIGLIKKLDGTYLKLGNQDGVVVDGAPDASIGGVADGAGNIIAGNNGLGVMLKDLDVASLVGNLVGTDPAGTPGMGNGSHGVLVQDSKNVALGLPSGGGNILAGNGGYGAFLKSTDATLGKLTELIQVQQNVMGSIIQNLGNAPVRAGQLPTGSSFLGNIFSKVLVALPNGLGGLCALDTHDVTVGGIGNLLGNILSGNSGPGAHVTGPSSQTLKLIGNLIGSDGLLDTGLGNLGAGILVENAPGTAIGGPTPDGGNAVVSNLLEGVKVLNSLLTTIQNNTIGVINNLQGPIRTDAPATLVVMPNHRAGVRLESSQSCNVLYNTIGGNSLDGVVLNGATTTGNTVAGNAVGTDLLGTSQLGNGSNGVLIEFGAKLNTIGGPEPGAGNVIAFNGGAGVSLDASAGHCNVIDPNSIYGNAGLGIDLGGDGITPNDPGDADTGPNNLQNFPEISSAAIDSGGELKVHYRVDSAPGSSNYGADGLLVEMFAADPGGEGKRFLADVRYTQADFGAGEVEVDLGDASALGVGPGTSIVAATTDADGNTSEFTAVPIVVPGGIDLALSASAPPTVAAGGTFTVDAAVTNHGASAATAVTVTFSLPTGLDALPTAGCSGPSDHPVCSLPDLAAGAGAGIALQVAVAADLSGTVQLSVEAAAAEPDSDPSDNSRTLDLTVATGADLSLAISSSPTPGLLGSPVTVLLTVVNHGPGTAIGSTLVAKLPLWEGSLAVSGGGDCNRQDQLLTCDLGDLASGVTAEISLDLEGLALGRYVVDGRVSSAVVDPAPDNDTGHAEFTVVPAADLALQLRISGTVDTIPPWRIPYQITVSNLGPSTATEVFTTQELPEGSTDVVVTGADYPGTVRCLIEGDTVTCALGSLQQGKETVLSVTVTPPRGAKPVSTAEVHAAEPDPHPENNTGTAIGFSQDARSASARAAGGG